MKQATLFLLLTAFLLTAVCPMHGYTPSGIGKVPAGSQKGMYRQYLSEPVKDASNNLATVSNPGWLTDEYHPETGAVSYSYYDSGKVDTITKASGKVISFTYDTVYRPLTQTSGTGADAVAIDFYYDGDPVPGYGGTYQNAVNHRTGARVRRGSPLVEESRIVWPWYDDQGRNLRKESVLASPAITNVMGFGYDSMGNLASIAYPDGRVTANYTYGPSTNLLTGVSVTGSAGTINLATALSHNPAGGLQNVMYGNGVETEILPDIRNRHDTWQTVIGAVDLINHDFTYDDFGNITDISAEHFVYDNLNRLTNATGISGRNFTYGYDANGNVLLVAKTIPAESNSFTYTSNHLNGVTYDADGNLTDDRFYTYDYDQLGQMTSSGTDSYAYDALGKRILKTTGTDNLAYCYLGEQLISTYDENLLSYYDEIYIEGQLLARVVDDGVSITDVTYAHLNHLGSPVAFTDDAGAVVWPGQTGGTPYEVHSYEPFGADFADLGSPIIEQDVRFTGKLFDASTEKHYFNARYYNGITTDASYEMPPRFQSPDVINGNPENGQSWNRYGYCLNNPLRYVDPKGQIAETFLDIISIGWSSVDLIRNPSWGNAGFLGWDIGSAVLPFVPGSYVAKGAELLSKSDDAIEAANFIAKSDEVVDAAKKLTPNPFGKKGGAAHQGKVGEVTADIESRGLEVGFEHKVSTPGGNKETRYIDVVGKDAQGNVVEMHQIGRQTKSGQPVSRERKAIEDIEGITRLRPYFHPYN